MPDQSKYSVKLSGKRVLVIGGSSGIGFAVSEASLEHGASVTISSSNQARVEKAIERLAALYPSKKGSISGYVCDLGTEESLEPNVQALFEKVGKVDHIVITAGDRLATIPIQDATLPQIKKAGLVRFFAPLIIAKVGSKYITPGPESSFTLTTGTVSQKPIANWTIPGSYASGLHAMTRGLALDLKPVRVNLVSPGLVDNEFWSHLPETQRAAMMKQRASALPTGAAGKSEDVAEAYVYAMKDKNLTGSIISTNSGALLV